jgi:hypothetical protein
VDRRIAVAAGATVVGIGLLGGGAWALRGLPGKLERLAHRQLESSVNADVAWGRVELGGLSSLPRVGFAVRDVVVTGRGPFAGLELARLERVALEVDLVAALTGDTMRVRSVEVAGGAVTLRVDREGRANWDVSKGASDEGAFELLLDQVTVRDLDLAYEDRPGKVAVRVDDLDADGTAAWSGPVASTKARATIGALDVRMGRTRYLDRSAWVVDADAAYDTATGGLSIASSSTTINAFPVSLTGSLVPAGDGWNVDLAFRGEDGGFASLLSLVPRAYSGSMEGVRAKGTVGFEGTAKGLYEGDTWPAFDVALTVADAAYRYPSLPEVNDIAVKARARHAQGPSASVGLDLDELSVSTGGRPFTAKGSIDRMLGDPKLDLTARGQLDLGALAGSLPVPDGTAVAAGVLDVDLAVKGAQSDFEAPDPARIDARGTIVGRGVRVVSETFPEPVTLAALDLSFTPQSTEIRTLAAAWGDSDLSASGRLDNLVGYVLGSDVLRGEVALTSRSLDLRPFQGRDAEAGTTAEDGFVLAVPTDLDLHLTSDLKTVRTRAVTFTDVAGTMSVAGGAIRMEDVTASMLGGRATVSGAYVAPTAESADIDLSVDSLSFDVNDTVATFVTLRRVAPVLEHLRGEFDAGFTLKTRIGKDGTPDLQLTKSAGRLAPTGAANVAALKGAEGKLRPLAGDGFGAVELAGGALQYVLSEGTLTLPPAKVRLGSAPATLSGTADVAKRTLDLRFTTELPLAAAAAVLGADAPKGATEVVIRVRGSYDDPKVTVGLKGAEDDAAGAAAGLAADAARARADQILAQARAAADALLAEADARAKKLVKQADDPAAKLAAEAAAGVIREKARTAADALLAEARKKADAVLAEAGGGGGESGKGGGKKDKPKKGKKK